MVEEEKEVMMSERMTCWPEREVSRREMGRVSAEEGENTQYPQLVLENADHGVNVESINSTLIVDTSDTATANHHAPEDGLTVMLI